MSGLGEAGEVVVFLEVADMEVEAGTMEVGVVEATTVEVEGAGLGGDGDGHMDGRTTRSTKSLPTVAFGGAPRGRPAVCLRMEPVGAFSLRRQQTGQ